MQTVIPVGGIIIWTNLIIPQNWGICDGSTYGYITTPDLRNKFILGYGTNSVGSSGGSTTIGINNLPAHNHPISINDGGHGHTINDPTHSHSVNDPGHNHNFTDNYFQGTSGAYGAWIGGGSFIEASQTGQNTTGNTSTNPTNILIYSNFTGISINNNTTGITASSANTGSGQAFLPPFFALVYIMRYK